MSRFSTYEYENQIKIEKRKMMKLIENYNDLKMIFPILLAYAKKTTNSKERLNITMNLEAVGIMYNDTVKCLKSRRKIKLTEYEEINETLEDLLSTLQKYHYNLMLTQKIKGEPILPNF